MHSLTQNNMNWGLKLEKGIGFIVLVCLAGVVGIYGGLSVIQRVVASSNVEEDSYSFWDNTPDIQAVNVPQTFYTVGYPLCLQYCQDDRGELQSAAGYKVLSWSTIQP